MRISIGRHRLLAGAAAVMATGVTLEVLQALTGLGGHGLRVIADKWDYTAVELVAVVTCAARAWTRREDRLAWIFMTVGLFVWTAGDLTWTLWLDNLATPPDPSLADAFYLTMYPLLYVAVMLLIRARLRGASSAQWIDGGVAGLAAAAVGAGLVFDRVVAAGQGGLAAQLTNMAYPVGDFTLLLFVALAFALSGWRPGRAWILVGSGLTLSAAADIIYVYQSATGAYVPGGVLDAAWPAAMALVALAAWAPARHRPSELVPAPHTILLTLLAAMIALVLLVLAAFHHVSPLAVSLAAGSLILACVRGAMTYSENVRMLRQSAHQALTDPLSGLGNRRRLMDDLERALGDRSAVWTLLFFDLNGFKRYNDSFGHAAGDALLARIGESLRAAVAEPGRAYRLGGDEFCVLLPGGLGVDHPLVRAAASALVERGSAFTIHASLGIAALPEDAATPSAALQLTDERMYDDKARRSPAGRAQAHDVLMALLGERAPGLHDHVTGVGVLASAIGTDLDLDSEEMDELRRAAELHDIGKLAIPDQILQKPGPLNDEEWGFIRQHPIIGERILNAAPALRPVARLVRASHERWDGRGYPDRLFGTNIPLGARIVAVCDAYDAMTSDRCYRSSRSPGEAVEELEQCAGSQFDPTVVRAAVRALRSGSVSREERADDSGSPAGSETVLRAR